MGVSDRAIRKFSRRSGWKEPTPLFGSAKTLARAGVLLALPLLVEGGVFACAQKASGSLGSAFYGFGRKTGDGKTKANALQEWTTPGGSLQRPNSIPSNHCDTEDIDRCPYGEFISQSQKILRDEVIMLSNAKKPAPELMRRVVALVQIDDQERELVFLTNHLRWSPRSIAELHRCRWQSKCSLTK